MIPKYVILEYGIAEGSKNPLNYKVPKSFEESSEHMSQIYGVIKENAKFDFDVVSLPFSLAEDWLKQNKEKVFCLSASVRGFMNGEWLSQFKNDFYMACSVGNSGSEGEGWNAEKDYFTGIGAVGEKHELKPYSSYGKGFVEFVGIIKNGFTKYIYEGKEHKKRLEGTSFSCPQHTTQIMNLMVDYYKRYGKKPDLKTVLEIRNKYCVDLLDPGKDLKTGYGVYQYNKAHLDNLVQDEIPEVVYKTLEQVPDWGKKTVEKLINKGVLKGDESGLNLEHFMLRILVIHDRMGLYDLIEKEK